MRPNPASIDATMPVRSGSAQAWAVAVRPRTLAVALSPVLVGATFGFERTGTIDVLAALLVLGAALLMQLITNMQNDVGYTVRGGDSSGTRTGLPRATANGWLSVRHVRTAIVLAAIVAVALGLALASRRGWPVIAIGVSSLLAALAYMGGPRPIAYTPFGEFVVFVFFGLVAVAGSDFIQTGNIGFSTWLASIALGALAAAALAVNNQRDIEHDRSVGRRTFPVVFGARTARGMYAASIVGAFFLVLPIAWVDGAPTLLAPLLLLPAALRLNRDFVACPPGLAYNAILVRTFKLELGYAALMASGAVAARLLA